jgi:uncharacterized protein
VSVISTSLGRHSVCGWQFVAGGLPLLCRSVYDPPMRRTLMDILACPLCKAELRLEATTEEPAAAGDPSGPEVVEGSLTCTACGEVYPITGGIPNLLPPDLREAMAADAAKPSGH